MNKNEMDKLIQASRKVFYDEICDKIKIVKELLYEHKDKCQGKHAEELVKFFHKINGTGATLGLYDIAIIGQDWMERLKKEFKQDGFIGKETIKEVKEVLSSMEKKLNCLEMNETMDKNLFNEDSIADLEDRGKILLVDDDLAILKLLENALINKGHFVHICDDPILAFDYIINNRPDIIILDVMMPEISGHELLKRIKNEPELAHIHVIFLSVADSIDDRIEGMKLGADDYITKPFVIDEVIARVETVLRRLKVTKGIQYEEGSKRIYPRQYFNNRIVEEIERYRRNGTIFSIALIKIDGFSDIRNKFGYWISDDVLKFLGSFIMKGIRKYDSLYRYGSEEFIMILPDTQDSNALIAMERVRRGFGREGIPIEGIVLNATFSAGIVQVYDEEDINGEKLIKNAYEALYKARSLGGNKVVIYEFS